MNLHQIKPLPKMPLSVVAMIGPAFIWASFAQGSGELIWWPYLGAKYGLALVGLLIPACLMQYFVNAEVTRYTALTGEGIWAGFNRVNGGYSVFLFILCLVSFLWFGGYASAGGTALFALTGFPFGFSERGGSLFWGYLTIFIFSIGMLRSSRVYKLLEKFMKIVIGITVVGLVISVSNSQTLSTWDTFFPALLNPLTVISPENWDPGDASILITAIAFAGLGGFFTLMYSYWVKEKGVGMAHYTEKVSETESSDEISGCYFEDNRENKENWKFWRKYLRIDNLVGIIINLLTVVITTWLAVSILAPTGIYPEGWKIAVVQSEFFYQWMGIAGKIMFLIIAAAFLGDTWFAAADGASRMFADFTLTSFSSAKSKSFKYWYYVWLKALIVITCITMPLAQPGMLIQIGGVIGIFGFVLYIPVLYVLNYRIVLKKFPDWVVPPWWRASLLWLVWAIYLAIAIWFIYIII